MTSLSPPVELDVLSEGEVPPLLPPAPLAQVVVGPPHHRGDARVGHKVIVVGVMEVHGITEQYVFGYLQRATPANLVQYSYSLHLHSQ